MSRSRNRRLLASLAALLVGLPLAVGAEQLPPGGGNAPAFEIDGDVVADDSGDGSLDWDDALAGSEADDGVIDAVRNPDGTCTQTGEVVFGSPGSKGTGALVCDGSVGSFPDQDVFGAGDKEEEGSDPVQWTIRPGSVPKKADLSEVSVFATVGDSSFENDPGMIVDDDLFLAVAMTRLDVNGDTHADFEFNQKPLTAAGSEHCGPAAGTHCQDRSDGDLLVAVDLDAGAAAPTTRVFQFRDAPAPGETCADTRETPGSGCFVPVPAPTSPSGDPSVLAVVNPAETAAPSWGTVGCEPVTGDRKPGCRPRARIPARGTLEAYVDLSAFLQRDLDLCPGFGQLTAKTRSSSSVSSSLSDVAGPVALTASVCNSVLIANLDRHGQPVAGAGVHFDPDPLTSEGGTTRTIVDGSGDDRAGGANGTICVDGVGFGTYRLIEALVPDGYFGDPDTEEVAVVSPSTCAQRLDTTGAPRAGQAIDATFVNPRGAFLIRNQDDRGDLLGGATFAISPDPRTRQAGSTLAMTDSDGDGLVCVEDVFVDGALRDANQPTPYDITQTKAPRNYTLDPTINTVGVTEPGTCATETPDAPDATFTNTRGKGGKP